VADLLLEESFTVTPPVGAPLVSVAVPVELVPPVTVAGLSEIDFSVAPLMVSVALLLALFQTAQIFALVCLGTESV